MKIFKNLSSSNSTIKTINVFFNLCFKPIIFTLLFLDKLLNNSSPFFNPWWMNFLTYSWNGRNRCRVFHVMIMLEICLLQGSFWKSFSFTNNDTKNGLCTAQKPNLGGYFSENESIIRMYYGDSQIRFRIHFLMINTLLIEKTSHVHKVTLDVFFHHCTSVVLTIILEKTWKSINFFQMLKSP